MNLFLPGNDAYGNLLCFSVKRLLIAVPLIIIYDCNDGLVGSDLNENLCEGLTLDMDGELVKISKRYSIDVYFFVPQFLFN